MTTLLSGWIHLPGLLSHFRQWRWATALSIGGLAAAIAVCLVTGQVIRYEVGYNGWVPDARNVWLVESHSNDMTSERPAPTTPFVAWSAIRDDVPDAIGTRVNKAKVAVGRDAITRRRSLLLVDDGFFRVFPMQIVAGGVAGWARQADALVLSQQSAKRHFGDADPIGRTLHYGHRGQGQKGRVIAVVADPPLNTDLHFDVISHLSVAIASSGSAYDRQHDWSYRAPCRHPA